MQFVRSLVIPLKSSLAFDDVGVMFLFKTIITLLFLGIKFPSILAVFMHC